MSKTLWFWLFCSGHFSRAIKTVNFLIQDCNHVVTCIVMFRVWWSLTDTELHAQFIFFKFKHSLRAWYWLFSLGSILIRCSSCFQVRSLASGSCLPALRESRLPARGFRRAASGAASGAWLPARSFRRASGIPHTLTRTGMYQYVPIRYFQSMVYTTE